MPTTQDLQQIKIYFAENALTNKRMQTVKCTFKTIKYWFIYKEKLEEGGVRGQSKSQEGRLRVYSMAILNFGFILRL